MTTANKKIQSAATIADFKYDRELMLDTLIDSLKGIAYCNLFDEHWTMVFVSKGAEELTGYSPDDLINNRVISYEQITHEDDRARVRNTIEYAISTDASFEVEYRIRHRNGSIVWVIERGSAIYNNMDQVLALEGYIENITKRKNAEHSLRETEARYRSIFENSMEGIFQTTPTGEYLIVNSALANIYGYQSPDELMEDLNNIQQQLYVLPSRRDEFVQVMAANKRVTNFESQVYKKDGSTIWISENARMVYGDSGQFLYYEGSVHDVTELRVAQDALKTSEMLAKQALDELVYQKYALDKHAIVAITDAKGLITYVNDKFCEISGYSKDELIGNDHKKINSGHHPSDFFKEMYRTIVKGDTWNNEVCNRAKNGSLYWLETTIVPFMGDNGKPQRYISIRTDITNRKKSEEKSHYLAFYDQLTSLPNRRLLVDRLTQALASSARSHRNGALLFLDLDHFKTLNDTLGHHVGDVLLQQVSERLTSCVREGDTVARLGGDEFVVLLEDLSEHPIEAATQTESIGEKILAILNQPYQLAAYEYQSTPSIGVALFSDQEHSQEDLLKHADIAMYQAKKAGRNRLSFFDPHMQDVINSRVDLERELRKAVDNQQFQLHYQLQVDQTGKALGAEVLIRWLHPERGMISPLQFIPMAEETGLILPIGQWVLDSACKQIKAWQHDEITRNLVLAVNVSAKQFRQADFVSQVQETVQRHGINPARLKLELTESMLVDDIKKIISTMNSLKNIGIKFSLDDFGTGYSSLQYLKKLPLDQLKIDQSFVRDIATDYSDRAIVLTIITMANSLGLDVIAEGVETGDQRQFLLDNGCVNYQGYLFSKPIAIDGFEGLIRAIDP